MYRHFHFLENDDSEIEIINHEEILGIQNNKMETLIQWVTSIILIFTINNNFPEFKFEKRNSLSIVMSKGKQDFNVKLNVLENSKFFIPLILHVSPE